jgi:hypothetical protein
MSKNQRRKAARYGTSPSGLHSTREGSGVNRQLRVTDHGLPSGETFATDSPRMTRRAQVRHRGHKYDESRFQTDHAMREVMHLIGR